MRRLTALLLTFALAACNGNGGGAAPVGGQPLEVDFQQFVQDQIAATVDDDDPIDLDDIEFLGQFDETPGFGNLLN